MNTGRRKLLQSAATLGAIALLPFSAWPKAPQASPNEEFISVSKFLTGRTDLSPEFAQALSVAFTKTDPAFQSKISKLADFISARNPLAADLAHQLAIDPAYVEIDDLPGTILTGWYLGIAGIGADAICVTYTQALANRLVADVLSPPSYAYGVYGSWADKPA
ncbi:hypothetical protein TM49_09285 [Martelella endophytica]|uniref:Sorbitol dehydrogenase n=1 Tax=Martelella endophytica TaxID=1486262 RepID=A0A0D5LVS9_MAREN|nr:hypothetical protein TM49_09285 [Martelella endophytica]